MPKRKTRAQKPAVPKKKQPTLVTNLREVQALHRQAVGVDILMYGKVFRFEGHRLIPAESNRIQHMMQLALPPLLPPEKEGAEARYNFDDPDYKKRHEDSRRNARSLALWIGYPCFKTEAALCVEEKKMEKLPETVEEIMNFIETREIDDDALQALFVGLTQNVVQLQEYINFTSGNGFQKS